MGAFLSTTALTDAAVAQAKCTLSWDAFTRTCTGGVSTPQSFNQMNVTEKATSDYVFHIQELTSSSAISSNDPIGVFYMQNTEQQVSNGDGANGGSESFSLNTDGAVSSFGVKSTAPYGIQLLSEGEQGNNGGNSDGDGDRTGRTGHLGGAGGAIGAAIKDTTITGKETA